MKKILLLAISVFFVSSIFAQYRRQPPPTFSGDDDDAISNKGFNKERIFVGGSFTLGYYGNIFNIGANPEIGYSFNKWLDAGVAFNINYESQSADPTYFYNDDVGFKATSFGGGVFARIYPIRFLYIQVQPEENWIHETTSYPSQNISGTASGSAASLIAGIGYTSRIVGRSAGFIMVGIDLLHNQYSPYLDATGSPIPIIRAGFDIYLHSSR